MSSDPTPDVKFEIGHVLFIDIVGYSKLFINEQTDQVQTLNEIVRGTERFRTAESESKLLRLPTGDGGALVFRSTTAETPVLCALEISKELKKHPELRVRMGIHSGPVNEITDLNEQANIAGAGVNVAQRVMACGDPGHILVSRHVAEDLESYGHWRPLLHDLGECEVKHGLRLHVFNLYKSEDDGFGNPELPPQFRNIPSIAARTGGRTKQVAFTVAMVATALALLAVFLTRDRLTRGMGNGPPGAASLSIPEKSVAVLPFENLSNDKENAYFAEGVQDEILTRLAKVGDLKVISRTSTQNYKSAGENPAEIGRQLRVAHIVEGSVQKNGDAVRVNVQLIKAANNLHLWADTFDRKLTDIFSVESEVAKAIADQLQAKLTGREEQEIASKPTNNPDAYDAYLRGLSYLQKALDTTATILAAQKYLRDTVRLDPKFALAWAKLSYCDSYAFIGNISTTAAVREEARQAADTALDLQPGLGEALLAKGYYNYWCLKEYDTAIRYFEQAARALPNSGEIPAALAYVARRRGAWKESESHFNEAERLDPRNVDVLVQHALLYWTLRRFHDATQKVDQVLGIIPNDPDMLALQASIAQSEGDLRRAAELLRPLRGTAEEIKVLETQIDQARYERNPVEMIRRIEEVLASPNPSLATVNGELRFNLGWLQHLAGDDAAAQATWQQARNELEALLPEQPDDTVLLADLALTVAAQKDKTAALSYGERATSLVPMEKDALLGATRLETLARVCAQVGEPDRAIATLQKLLTIPYEAPITPALLRLDPMFDSLRNDARFQRLCEDEAR